MHSPSASSTASDEDEKPENVVILHASETGNAQDTAERVGREFRRLGRQCIILSMNDFDVVSLAPFMAPQV